MLNKTKARIVRKRVFTTGDVAKICNVAARTVAKWFNSGRLKGYRIPGSPDRRIPREQLIRFLKEHGMDASELESEQAYKVLLVACEVSLSGRLAGLLEPHGEVRLELAADGFAAGTLYAGLRPDAVVVDLALGRGESLALARRVREQEEWQGKEQGKGRNGNGNGSARRTLLVALCGEDFADPHGSLSQGWDAVLQHPFDPALLAERLRRGMDGD